MIMYGIVFSLFVCGAYGAGADWNHDISDVVKGPLHWDTKHPECGGKSQSPIQIWTDTTFYNPELTPFKFEIPDSTGKIKLENTGHGAKVSFGTDKPTVSGGGLPGIYELQQFHFHTGNGSARGSEHLIDSAAFIGEAHFVFSNKELNGSHVMTSKNPPGLAVLGVLLKTGGSHHPGWEKVISKFGSIKNISSKADMDYVNMRELMPDMDNFYRYSGSLTTPSCNEVVMWTVFRNPIYLSLNQVEKLVGIDHGYGIPYTYRPIQPLNGRTVWRSYRAPGDTVNGANIHIAHFATICMVMVFSISL